MANLYQVTIEYPDKATDRVIALKHLIRAYTAEDAKTQAEMKWCSSEDHVIVSVEPYDGTE